MESEWGRGGVGGRGRDEGGIGRERGGRRGQGWGRVSGWRDEGREGGREAKNKREKNPFALIRMTCDILIIR